MLVNITDFFHYVSMFLLAAHVSVQEEMNQRHLLFQREATLRLWLAIQELIFTLNKSVRQDENKMKCLINFVKK
jgi:hypothetical protein